MKKFIVFYAFALLLLGGCSSNKGKSSNVKAETNEQSDGWISLFDGKTIKGWHTYGKTEAGTAWKVEDGALHLDASQKDEWQTKGGGDLVSDEEFEDFHLQLEWKISRAGNSGIIFYVHEEPSKYEQTWNTGMEMQVADNDENEDGKINKHRAGELYDLIPASKDVIKKAGEWNAVEIISNNGKLDFYVNGTHTLSTSLWDDNWKNLIAQSKFNTMPDFGTFRKGRIALQDHGADVWFRHIRIKKL
ncbi:DUF1080 domain-containing protein [Chitinophagaceae bacterium LB-8]|uniref:DUF1080 domain-containing protein n=1 Tax=Paraflavisolibacter caeni TaxID=2982496 RepID=A0A9X2XNN4_9BACT|nr:DUF1080 domain-containing protein [Paraflavisolibacter caeni]MCU7548684.1 DUF1080 domain-containing protein [Paraflavisolibacter caeni]